MSLTFRVWLWLLLTATLAAEPLHNVRLRIRTEPSDLTVYALRDGSFEPLPVKDGLRLVGRVNDTLQVAFGWPDQDWRSDPVEIGREACQRGQWPPGEQAPYKVEAPPEVVRAHRSHAAATALRRWGWVALPGLVLAALAWRQARRFLRAGRGRPVAGTAPIPQLDKYTLGMRLGSGAMADVYQASARNDSVQYAIKLLRADLEDDNTRKRFLREVQICVQNRHPNIVELYDWGEHDGRLYLVLELLQGRTLRNYLQDDPQPPPEWCIDKLKSLAAALQFLHERGIVHRDVKPDNLFLCDTGILKLMDFGIARGLDLTVATQTGMTMGTPAYMAPEQVQGRFEAASDQYAVGVLAFRMFTGRLPFEDDDVIALAMKQIQNAPPDPRSLNPGLTPPQAAAILRMLAKHPSQRFPSVVEAVQALVPLPSDNEATAGW